MMKVFIYSVYYGCVFSDARNIVMQSLVIWTFFSSAFFRLDHTERCVVRLLSLLISIENRSF